MAANTRDTMTADTMTADAMTAPVRRKKGEARSPDELWIDKYGGEYAPDLYQYRALVGPTDGAQGFGGLTDEHFEFFEEQGYLVVHHAFSTADVAAAKEGLLDLVDGKVPEFGGIQFEAAARPIMGTLTRETRQDYVRKLQNYVQYDARLGSLSAHPQLLAAVERIIQAPPQLFANQAMIKPPLIGREKPWHQDHAFFRVKLGARVVGCWIALDEATPENGCMHVIPGSSREGPVVHFQRRDWQICDEHVARARIVAVPLEPGGLLFFDSMTHHGTPASASTKRRRALQFHYAAADEVEIPVEERMAIFGSEGKDVTC